MTMTPLFPLGTTLFPGGVLPLRVFEVRYLDMVKKCIADKTEFGVVTLLSGSEVRTPEGEDVLATHGTMARIDSWTAPMPGLIHLRCIGSSRFELSGAELGQFGLWRGRASPLADDPPTPIPAKLQVIANRLGRLIAGLQKDRIPEDEMPIGRPYFLDESGWVANRWAELLQLPLSDRLHLLAMADPIARLTWIHDYLKQRGALA